MKRRSEVSTLIAVILFFSIDASEKIDCDTMSIFGKEKVTCITNNCPADSVKNIYENGTLRRKYTYYSCRDSGEFVYLSEKGDTLSWSFFLNGKTIGVAKYWYENGYPKRTINYDSTGNKNGWEVFWYDNGNVKDSAYFQNDSISHGKSFYYNGRISVKEKDIFSSYDAVSYDPKGKKTGEVKDGTGTIFVCDSVGGDCKELTYKDGKRVFR